MDISKIFNANVYVNGASQLGRAAEVTLPEIVVKMVEHSALGMIGTLELPTGLEAMAMKIKWSGFYADLFKLGVNPFTTVALQLRASHETYDENGRNAQVPITVDVRGVWKKKPLGTFKAQESGEYEEELSIEYVKVALDGVELLEVDVRNNIWKVGGVDLLEQWRANLGA